MTLASEGFARETLRSRRKGAAIALKLRGEIARRDESTLHRPARRAIRSVSRHSTRPHSWHRPDPPNANSKKRANTSQKVVRPAGFEPTTFCSGVRRRDRLRKRVRAADCGDLRRIGAVPPVAARTQIGKLRGFAGESGRSLWRQNGNEPGERPERFEGRASSPIGGLAIRVARWGGGDDDKERASAPPKRLADTARNLRRASRGRGRSHWRRTLAAKLDAEDC